MKNQDRLNYIVKRAAWIGCATRNDLIRAFGISPNLASLDLANAVKEYPKLLARNGRLGVNFIGLNKPFLARPSKLLSLFEQSAQEWETGLTNDEMQVLVSNKSIYRSSDAILDVIMTACIKKISIKISYTGLKVNERIKTRVVFPIGLEFTGKQWRVIASDEVSGTQKTFVLARISSAEFLPNLERRRGDEKILTDLVDCQVQFNSVLNMDQIMVLSNEFGVKDNSIKISKRDLFEFKKLFCKPSADDAKSNAVWPIFNSADFTSK